MIERYIVNGGCSYVHKSIDSIRKILGHSITNIEVIDIDCPASSNRYISESIITAVNVLLEKGIDSEKIIVINNFTQIGRENPIVPEKIQNEIKNNFLITQNRVNYGVNYKFYNSFVELNKRMYCLMIGDEGLSEYGKEWYKKQEFYIEESRNITSVFENYLLDIVNLQRFLKNKKINHVSFLMNNVIDGWDKNFSHLYTKSTKWELPSTKNTIHISEFSEYCKILWESIDFESLLFYKTENNKYGGIDEYFIDKIKDVDYLENTPQNKGEFYSNHPKSKVYELFTNEVLEPKLKKWKIQNIL